MGKSSFSMIFIRFFIMHDLIHLLFLSFYFSFYLWLQRNFVFVVLIDCALAKLLAQGVYGIS